MGWGARFLGGTGEKKGLNVEKLPFFQGLRRDFSGLSLTHQNTLFYAFSDQIHPPQISKSTKKLYFWTNLNSSLIFLPSPSSYFGAKFQILLYSPIRSLSSYISQNFVFKTYAYPKLSRKTLGGVDLTPPPPGIRRVKAILVKLHMSSIVALLSLPRYLNKIKRAK